MTDEKANRMFQDIINVSLKRQFDDMYGLNPEHPGERFVPAKFDEDTKEMTSPGRWVKIDDFWPEILEK